MKQFFVVGTAILLITSNAAFAQTNAPAAASTPSAASAPPPVPPPARKPIIFHAPSDTTGGLLPIRVGGGSRAGMAGAPELRVLVPDGVGETTQAQPAFYCYLSKPAKTFLEITVTEPKHAKPLFAQKTPVSEQSGILAIRLAKYDVTLKPGVVYKWNVAVVMDPDKRSGDIVASGIVKRVEPTPELTADLAKASDADKASVYAAHGIFYDALQTVSDEIVKSPNDEALRQERADLLKQVNLDGPGMEAATKAH